MTKRVISFVLLLSMIFAIIPLNVSSATNYTKTITAYNETRFENYLVIYNTGSSTGTNPYGYEVTVSNGIVTKIGGNNSAIPSGSNSFVVSGHGTMSDWLADNIIVGMKCSYSTSTNKVTFVYDDETIINYIELTRATALEAKQSAIEACIVYDTKADSELASAEITYNTIIADFADGQVPTRGQADALVEKYDTICSLYTESAVTEYRGAWVRPTQTSYAEVDAWVKKAYDSGLNMISVETLYSSTMIFPTPKGSLFEHNPIFGGFDVLEAYVTACHKYGMELHVWMPVFYSGSNGDGNWKRSVAYKKPAWRLTSNSGNMVSSDEYYGLVFLNPALDEVQDCLIEMYEYILTNYDIDGFQLDYIRYKERSGNDDFGYDSATIAEFKEAYPRYANTTIIYNTNASYWNDWVAFRTSQVTEMVHRVRALIDRVSPEVMLTADVGPSYNDAYGGLYQDYKSWLQDGLLDMIHPMAYGTDYSPLMLPFFDWAGEGCLVVPGLGAYMTEFDATDMLKQARDMLSVGCDGVVYFEITAFFNKNCGKLLTESLFSQRAVPPHLDIKKTLELNLTRLTERAEKAAEAGTIGAELVNKITSLVNEAVAVERPVDAIEKLTSLAELIKGISSQPLLARLSEDLIRAGQTCARDLRDGSSIWERFVGKTYFTNTKNYIILGEGEALPTVEELSEMLPYGQVYEFGFPIGSDEKVATGFTLSNGFASFDIIVKGDINGDGKVSSLDYILLKRHVLKARTLEEIEAVAANIYQPEKDVINSMDYIFIKRHVLKKINIHS